MKSRANLLLSLIAGFFLASCHMQENKILNYKDGEPKYRYHLLDGLQSGRSIGYYHNGNLRSLALWKQGKQDGKAYIFYQNGELKKISNWKLGLPDGKFYTFYKNGKPAIISSWKNGSRIGWNYEYFESGTIKTKSILIADSLRVVIICNESGKPVEKHIENNEKIVYISKYNELGKEELGFMIPIYEGEEDLLYTIYINNPKPIKMGFGFKFNNQTKLLISPYKKFERNVDTVSISTENGDMYFLINHFKLTKGINNIYYKFICSKCNDTLSGKAISGNQVGSHKYFVKQ